MDLTLGFSLDPIVPDIPSKFSFSLFFGLVLVFPF